jgi:hypothetical protein
MKSQSHPAKPWEDRFWSWLCKNVLSGRPVPGATEAVLLPVDIFLRPPIIPRMILPTGCSHLPGCLGAAQEMQNEPAGHCNHVCDHHPSS